MCAIRFHPASGSTTCLLFDAMRTELQDTVRSLLHLPLDNPLAIISFLMKECGYSSESKRQFLDNYILRAEVRTKSTPWADPSTSAIRWPNDYFKAMSVLHLSQNNLIFVNHAVSFELTVWRLIQRMACDENLWKLLQMDTSQDEWASISDAVEFEMAHTLSRKAQIACLKDRIAVQIELVCHLSFTLAHGHSGI